MRDAWQRLPIDVRRWIFLLVAIAPGLIWLARDALGLGGAALDALMIGGFAALVFLFVLDR